MGSIRETKQSNLILVPLLIVHGWEILNLRTNHSEENLINVLVELNYSEGKLGELIDLISTIGFSDNQKAGDMLGEVYEYFLGNLHLQKEKRRSVLHPKHC